MLVLTVNEENIKDFMNKLLVDVLFDEFEVRGVEIHSFTKFEISGQILKEGEEEAAASVENDNIRFYTWKKLKPYVFHIIKGSKRPKLMKIVFSLNFEKTAAFHENSQALFINLSFENNIITLVNGLSQKNFSLDKSLDIKWDDAFKRFFVKNNIAFEIMD